MYEKSACVGAICELGLFLSTAVDLSCVYGIVGVELLAFVASPEVLEINYLHIWNREAHALLLVLVLSPYDV